ncbi:hypothetical protein HDU98_006706 [Podochytrium sp. JEL0797]|nr:hypothetical protein HDU98_006706 [Podochytrium sp. JEL0797]
MSYEPSKYAGKMAKPQIGLWSRNLKKPNRFVLIVMVTMVFASLQIAISKNRSTRPTSLFRGVLYKTIPVSQPPHSLLISEPNDTTGKHKLSLQSAPGCPIPKPALIGILSTTDPLNTARRALLRDRYTKVTQTQPAHEQIDIVYFFGIPRTNETRVALQLEQRAFPHDVVVADIPESRDSGKILEWFAYAREKRMYSPHPTVKGAWCSNYMYVAKGDDDSVFHLERLSNLVRNQLPAGTNYVGTYSEDLYNGFVMTGMVGLLYLMSPELVEWITHSPIPKQNLEGIEDVQVAIWLQKSGAQYSLVKMDPNVFHDYAFSKKQYMYYDFPITVATVVVHYCKEIGDMKSCIAQVYDNAPPPYDETFTRSSITTLPTTWKDIHTLSHTLNLPLPPDAAQHIFSETSHHLRLQEYKPHLLYYLIRERTKSANIPFLEWLPDAYMIARIDAKEVSTPDEFIAQQAFVWRMDHFGMTRAYADSKIALAEPCAEIIKTRALVDGEFDWMLVDQRVRLRVGQMGLSKTEEEIESLVQGLLGMQWVASVVKEGDFEMRLMQMLVSRRMGKPVLLDVEIRALSDSLSDIFRFNATRIREILND